jgi:FkbM family methyltransferase
VQLHNFSDCDNTQKMLSLFEKLKRSYYVHVLTGRRWRAASVRANDKFRINGVERFVKGPACLSMLLEIVCDDVYGVRKCSKLSTVIDVGANIGIFCLQVQSRFPAARIFAVEPSAKNREYLVENVSDIATIVPCAIGVSDGLGRLTLGEDGTAYHLSEAQYAGETEAIKTISLETMVDRAGGQVDLLKTDSEGGEYALFKSPALRKVRRIVGELHTCVAGNPADGLDQLRAQGFRIERWRPFPDGRAGIVWATLENR